MIESKTECEDCERYQTCEITKSFWLLKSDVSHLCIDSDFLVSIDCKLYEQIN